MSQDLRNARDLAEKFCSAESIKLLRRQCSQLRVKVIEALCLAEDEETSCRDPASYRKVFRELCRVVHRVKRFTDDCCYKSESDFVLAAIKVTAHKERFIKYHVELSWCIFLIERIRDARGEPVASETLEGFQWKEKVELLVVETRSIVEKDFRDFKDDLRQHVRKPGEHQKICATLLRRFKEEADSPVVDDVDLGVPPIEAGSRKIGDKIGKGGFGKVYNFKWKKTPFAVKIPKRGTLDLEVGILEKCCHPNIVNLILFLKKPDGKQILMMEKLSMNLFEYLESVATGSSVPPLEAVDMILQIGEGMEYLSEIHRVSHRDMKPENILVKQMSGPDGPVLELQVSDFGLARVREAIERSSKQTPNIGTTRYRAPELTGVPPLGEDKFRAQSLKADMYSFAVTCSCILTGCEPYEAILLKPRGYEELKHFVKEGGRPDLPADCPPELASLLKKCWHPDPSKRPASFFEICEKLRNLKATLLTNVGDVHEGDCSGPNFPESGYVPFEAGVRPLRILVLGNANAVEATCRSMCGASWRFTEDRNRMIESVGTSPPMCLYRCATSRDDFMDFADIMSFVKGRNNRWHQASVKVAWRKDLYYSSDDTPFPGSSSRLHMVWYVCRRVRELPNSLQWKAITEKLNGLPVQILVTDTSEYENILRWKDRFSGVSQGVEDLIINVDLNDDAAKERLWRTCWEVKTKAEIKNAAMIIGYVQEQLGPRETVFLVGIVARRSRACSVERGKEFILKFLCSYWDVPQSFMEVLPSRTNSQEATKFVPFCLQDAAAILRREREHVQGLVPSDMSSDVVLGQAQAYFRDLDFDACDKMKSGDVQRFLEAVFENCPVPNPLVSELDRRWSLSKIIGLLCGNGPGLCASYVLRHETSSDSASNLLWTRDRPGGGFASTSTSTSTSTAVSSAGM